MLGTLLRLRGVGTWGCCRRGTGGMWGLCGGNGWIRWWWFVGIWTGALVGYIMRFGWLKRAYCGGDMAYNWSFSCIYFEILMTTCRSELQSYWNTWRISKTLLGLKPEHYKLVSRALEFWLLFLGQQLGSEDIWLWTLSSRSILEVSISLQTCVLVSVLNIFRGTSHLESASWSHLLFPRSWWVFTSCPVFDHFVKYIFCLKFILNRVSHSTFGQYWKTRHTWDKSSVANNPKTILISRSPSLSLYHQTPPPLQALRCSRATPLVGNAVKHIIQVLLKSIAAGAPRLQPLSHTGIFPSAPGGRTRTPLLTGIRYLSCQPNLPNGSQRNLGSVRFTLSPSTLVR